MAPLFSHGLEILPTLRIRNLLRGNWILSRQVVMWCFPIVNMYYLSCFICKLKKICLMVFTFTVYYLKSLLHNCLTSDCQTEPVLLSHWIILALSIMLYPCLIFHTTCSLICSQNCKKKGQNLSNSGKYWVENLNILVRRLDGMLKAILICFHALSQKVGFSLSFCPFFFPKISILKI